MNSAPQKTLLAGLLLVTTFSSAMVCLHIINQPALSEHVLIAKQPDAFMSKATVYQYDNRGYLQHRFQVERLLHFQKKNASRLYRPIFTINTPNGAPWIISARSGSTQEGMNVLHVWENVHVVQQATKASTRTDILTQQAFFYPQQWQVKTKSDVTVLQQGSVLKAHGMQANLKTGTVILLSNPQENYNGQAFPLSKKSKN